MKNILVALSLLLFVSCAKHDSNVSSISITDDEIKERIVKSYPNISISDIKKIDDYLYEIIINKQIYYATSDGKYLIVGNIINLDTKESITENTKMRQRVSTIKLINESDMIVYRPKKTDHVLTIFTDSSCPYCQKLHDEVNNLVDNNVEVRYVLFSRNGNEVEAYTQLVSAWCADERKEAVEEIFSGNLLDENLSCSNPIAKNYEYASILSVEGTPTIFLEDGRVIPGYQGYREILAIINK